LLLVGPVTSASFNDELVPENLDSLVRLESFVKKKLGE